AHQSRPAIWPHPRQAAGWSGVKFCASVAMLLAPRVVCASVVTTADPAKASPIARASATLRIGFISSVGGVRPTFGARLETGDLTCPAHLVHVHHCRIARRRGGKPQLGGGARWADRAASGRGKREKPRPW